MKKPFSQACENNKDPILQIIRTIFTQSEMVWEIGSGTGQHACYFARNLPHLVWQPTDREENLAGINRWVEEAELLNLRKSLPLDVRNNDWPCASIAALFSANTLHIMHLDEVAYFFAGLARYLTNQASVCIYGPFNYHDHYTSKSNERFDHWLRARDPFSGIRDITGLKS